MDTKPQNKHRVIFIMGVSGSGKTTIGRTLSARMDIPFYDGDDFHPPANLSKMKSGQALTDADRAGWLETIHQFLERAGMESDLIIACSALKETYRQQLMAGIEQRCIWVALTGAYDLLYERLCARKGHFMPPFLLQSQLDTLELPEYGLHLDIGQPAEVLVDCIINYFGL